MIEVKNLTKNYGNNRGIKNLTFKVEKGEILGLLGSNGAGKTTTMNLLTGYKPPTFGEIYVDGIDLLENPMEAKEKIGYLPEIPPLYPEFKLKAYLRFTSELKGVPAEQREDRIKKVMDLVHITDVQDRLIKNLSKGYKQRVGLAQALIANPDVLILDEPTVGLDPNQIHEMRSLIKSLGKEHTIILSSHILAEVSMVCDRVIILKKGEIVAIDTPQNLASDLYNTEKFFARIKGPSSHVLSEIKALEGVLSVDLQKMDPVDGFYGYIIEKSKNIDVKTPLFFKMASLGYAIHELRTVNASLEDIFIQLTTETKSNEEAV
ncbi:MAG: ABC transporter ATP-binding protein [Clostridiaceae bacterium]|mgnify:CR=1 FL=1|nr:ABC transporter ATP-binding protein [Clostridiaceae bacterium]